WLFYLYSSFICVREVREAVNWFWLKRAKKAENEDSLVNKLLDEIAYLHTQIEDIYEGQKRITRAATDIHQQMEVTTESNSTTLQRLQFTSEAIRVLVDPEGSWKR